MDPDIITALEKRPALKHPKQFFEGWQLMGSSVPLFECWVGYWTPTVKQQYHVALMPTDYQLRDWGFG